MLLGAPSWSCLVLESPQPGCTPSYFKNLTMRPAWNADDGEDTAMHATHQSQASYLFLFLLLLIVFNPPPIFLVVSTCLQGLHVISSGVWWKLPFRRSCRHSCRWQLLRGSARQCVCSLCPWHRAAWKLCICMARVKPVVGLLLLFFALQFFFLMMIVYSCMRVAQLHRAMGQTEVRKQGRGMDHGNRSSPMHMKNCALLRTACRRTA